MRPAPTGLLPALMTLAMLAGTPAVPQAAEPDLPMDLATFPRAELIITAAKGGPAHHFTVWVADTQARSQQGLMFVSDLPESQGMVFPLTPPKVETMWMHNTYIELDMVFFDANKRISKIISRAAPLSDDILSSGGPVAGVLELKGGLASQLGLRVGDSVSWTTLAHATPH
jgi:uncharacterized protein